MRKLFGVVSLLGGLLLSPAWGGAEGEAVPFPDWKADWEKAKTLLHQGSLLEAEGVYETLLKNEGARQKRGRIQKEYENLRIKIIFSPLITPESVSYTVVKGDTLYEIAKKNGTTIALLQKSNGIAGDQIYPGMKLKVVRTIFSIKVDKSKNRLILLADEKPIKRYRVATGEKGSTPSGTFRVINKLEEPTWYHKGKVIPPDSPENILGSRWLGFDRPGYGIHGTTLPESIGTQSSRGCIRMLDQDVEEIYPLLPIGTSVTVME